MSKKIQDKDIRYSIFKRVVDFMTRRSYRRFKIEGLENIPKDGCTIWASNHTNALMDPLVILSLTRTPKVFMARADIFKKPFVIKLLTFLKIMPIYRIRDGFEAVKRNDEIISRAVNVLADGVPITLFPEGTHRAKHSLLRLSKGVFHIALSVHEKVDNSTPVYILPIGIDYGDYFRFRSTALVRIGKPVNVSKYLAEHADEPQPVQMQQLRDILTGAMAGLISYVPDDEDYDAVWEYTKLNADNPHKFSEALRFEENKAGIAFRGLRRKQVVNRHFIDEIHTIMETDPERATQLLQKVDALRVWRIQNGVSVYSIARDRNVGLRAIGKLLAALVLLPYYIFSMAAYLLVYLVTLFWLSRIKDDAFYNTARLGVRFALSWICFVLWTVLAFVFLPWHWALVTAILLFFGYNFFTDYREFVRLGISDSLWLYKRRKAPGYGTDLFH